MVAEPGGLPLGILPTRKDGAGRCFFGRQPPGEHGRDFRHAKGAHGGQGGVKALGQQGPHFLNRAGLDHGRPTLGYGSAQFSPWRIEQNRRKTPRSRGGAGFRLPGGNASARTAPDLPCAGDALAVAGAEPRGGGRVLSRQTRMQGSRAFLSQKAPGFFAGWCWDGRDGGEAPGERRAIHARTAANDGKPPCRAGFFHGLERRIAPPGYRCGLGGFVHAVKQMRRAGFIRWAWASGDDAEFPIKLHAIGIDDGATQAFGDGKGECGFA